MNRVRYMPASSELDRFVCTICPTDVHIYLISYGVWSDLTDNQLMKFRGQFMSKDTTECTIVRAFSIHGSSYWTLEHWTHNNGYQCTLTVLDKSAFLNLIRNS